jgi:FKBP-type peptidyl-prolyl cis-trans isomerase
MKLSLITATLLSSLAAPALHAQETPPPAAPAPVPAPAAAPGTPGADANLLPAPAAEVPDGFQSEKERQSYALGSFLAAREKNAAANAGAETPTADDVIAGLKDVLSNGKSQGYAVGAQLALQIRRAEVDVDPEVLSQAVRDALAGTEQKLNPQQQQAVMQRIQNELQARVQAKRAAENEKAKKAADEFLAANGKTDGVQTTASGLQYKIEKQGDGKIPADTDMLMLNYKAQLTDGTVFEKSADTNPARKPFRILPKGIQEGVALLKAGGKAKFWVPPALGYGEPGRPPQVKPNAVLIYEIEIVAVEPLPKPQASGTQPNRQPVTAVTPPISVEIPAKPGEAPKVEPAPAATPAPAPAGGNK